MEDSGWQMWNTLMESEKELKILNRERLRKNQIESRRGAERWNIYVCVYFSISENIRQRNLRQKRQRIGRGKRQIKI